MTKENQLITRRDILKVAAGAPAFGGFAFAGVTANAQDLPTIRVGSKDFPEAIIIGEMYALLLENAGLSVERKLNLGGTAVAHEALLNGDLDLYPEYTGTGLLAVLGASMTDVPGISATPDAMASPMAAATPAAGGPADAVYAYVKEQYAAQFNLVWLDQSQMNDTQALAVKRSFAEENGIATISQLVALASTTELVISAPSDFEEREDGLAGLVRVYGEFDATVNGVAPGIKYQALLDDDANVVLAFSTDAEIVINDLVVLEDDLALWPPYYVAPVVRQETLDAAPVVADALNPLAPVLTTELQTQLNARVVGDEKAEPATVARDFLVEQGLIAG
jgi:osmoprotectant transport system substrate-binding protein